MTKWTRDALDAPHTMRELGVDVHAAGAEPVAWGEIYGEFVSVRLTKTRHHTVPLYTHPQDAESLRAEVVRVAKDRDDWRREYLSAAEHSIEAAGRHGKAEARAIEAEAERDAALARLAEVEAELADRGMSEAQIFSAAYEAGERDGKAALTPQPDDGLEALARQISQQVVPYDAHGAGHSQSDQRARRAAKDAVRAALRARNDGGVTGLNPAEVLEWLDGIGNPMPAQSPSHMARNYAARIRAALEGGDA